MLLASETSIQLTNALEKLIDSGIQLGERVLGALIIFGIKEQIDTITNSYNKWLYLFHISSC